MDRAALVVEVDKPMVVFGVGLGGMGRKANMDMASYRRRFIDVERVVVHYGNNASDLSNNVQPKQPPS